MEDRSEGTGDQSDGAGWRKESCAAGAIISVDLEKAFDQVERDLLWSIMVKLGFPLTFIRFLQTVNSVAKVNELNGNQSAGFIPHTASLRKGYPLSMHLFVIFIEPLIILPNNRLTGIHTPGNVVKVRGLVDDLAVFVSSDQDAIASCNTVEEFCVWSCAKVKKKKTKALGQMDLKNFLANTLAGIVNSREASRNFLLDLYRRNNGTHLKQDWGWSTWPVNSKHLQTSYSPPEGEIRQGMCFI